MSLELSGALVLGLGLAGGVITAFWAALLQTSVNIPKGSLVASFIGSIMLCIVGIVLLSAG